MLFTDTTFIGIDIPGIRRPLTYAAIDNDLNLIALGHGNQDEILAFIKGQEKAFVAVNNPRTTNKGIMALDSFRAGLIPRPKPGRWEGWRVAEYLLRLYRIKIRRTPREVQNAPKWMQAGFAIFKSLDDSGYRPYTRHYRVKEQGESSFPRYSIESYPHAAYTALLEHIPFAKTSLEGRIQRQSVLYVNDLDVPDPMQVFEEITRHRLLQGELYLDALYSTTQLDALVAAYTAHQASNGDITLLGHPDEGEIAIPVKELKTYYG